MSSAPREGSFVHRRLRILIPLRHRDFRLLWTGMTISLLGDGITTIALAWQAYEISNVATAFSMVMFSMAVPQVILLLVGGAMSDRFERRKVMLFADSIRMVALFVLGILSLGGHLEIWHMMVIAAFYGAGTAFFGPAFDAIVPELVPADELPAANALDQFVRPAAYRMLGPAVGGALIGIFGTPGDAFLVDGVTFSVSVACLVLMRPQRAAAGEERTSMVGEIKEGLAYVKTQTWLWGTFLAATLAYLVFWGPAEVLLPLVVKNEMNGSASELGVILALGGVGAMATAIVIGNREMPRRHMTFMYLVWTVSTLAIAGYGIATLPWHAMVFCFVFNALESAGLIVWITTKQRLVPSRLMGRVSSFDWFISTALVPVSYALTGPVAKAFGTRPTLVVAGLLGGAVTLAFLFIPGMRDLERRHVLAGVHLDTGVEGALEAQSQPGATPPADGLAASAAPEVAPTAAEPQPVATAAVAFDDGAPAAPVALDHGTAPAPVALNHGTAPVPVAFDDAATPVPVAFDDAVTPVPARHLRPVPDAEMSATFQTLADLRATLDRWRASRLDGDDPAPGREVGEDRVNGADPVRELEAEEHRLEGELRRVRQRLAELGAARPTGGDALAETPSRGVAAGAR